MNSIVRGILFTVFLIAIQLFVLNRIDLAFGRFNYIHLYIYPYLILMLLPFGFNRFYALFIAFAIGIVIDVFLGTYGIHASSLVFMTFLRGYWIQYIEPREGYEGLATPTLQRQGFSWIILYVAGLLFVHHLFLFSVEAFSFVYISEILLRTIFSFIGSFILMMIVIVLLNSR